MKLMTFVKNEQGLETVEYAIILGLIVVGTIVSVIAIGQWVRGQFSTLIELLPDNQ